MKQETRFMKRSLALLLVVVMVLSNLSGLTLPARAAGSSEALSYGEIVANNYDLTDAEKALLESGLLVGGVVTFTTPTNSDLISVNTDEKTISVKTYTDAQGNKWIPTAAGIYVGETKKEDVDLTDGKGNYTYGENAFSVKVTYTLTTTEIDIATQQNLLNAGGRLKQGIANLDAVSGQAGNLYILEQAMPALVDLANNGVQVTVGGNTTAVNFSDECKAAVNALNDQMTTNSGKLNLSVMVDGYDGFATKTGYLVQHGAEMQTEAKNSTAKLALISEAMSTMAANLTLFIQNGWVDETTANQISTLAGVCNNLVAGLEAVSADDWYAANHHANIVASGANYEKLDTLVAALGEQTDVTVKESLKVAETTVTLNMSMFNVTVNVVLKTVQNDNAINEYATKSVTLTLAKGATADEILAEIADNGIENAAKTEWTGAYVDGHFEASASELPATLTEDITYTITYSPKYYAVTFDYAEAQSLPYGYVLTLPRHEDPAQAYDYSVNGYPYAQGSTYTVEGHTVITRSVGKAYTTNDLYAIIADNYANDVLYNIMTSGALKNNETINVRQPDPADAEALVTLVNGNLTAEEAYDSDYNGLVWIPYSYGVNGNENLFNGNYTVEWPGGSVKVKYILVLETYSAADVQSILDNMDDLKTEADAQKSTLDALAANYDAMGQLDKTKLGALNGVIGVTDFTPGDGTDTDAENLRLRAYFTNVVGQIIANNVDSNNYLKIYNMLDKYKDPNTGGLTYYYNNSTAVIAEINSLSGYLTELVNEEEALKIMVGAAGFPEYADKIKDLEQSMASVTAALTAPNALIDLGSPDLYKLIDALETEGDATFITPDSPYLLSPALTALDETTAIVQVIVSVGEKTATFTTKEFAPGEVLGVEDVNVLIDDVKAFAAAQLGDKISFYQAAGLAELEAMVGTELTSGTLTKYVNYEAIQYTIVIDGKDEVTVDINNLQVTLPAHGEPGWVYVYTVFDREVTVGQTPVTVTLTAAELAAIVGDTYTITWTEYNKAEADTVGKLDSMVNELKNALGDENVMLSGDVLTVDMGASQLMDFVMTLVTNGGYSYYGLNGEGLIFMNSENTLQLSMQTLINAIFYDDNFSADSLIALGSNGKGELFTASMQLGDSADVLDYEDIELVVNLSSVPSQMQTALSALELMKGYLNFYSSNGILEVELNLPDQVYGAYLTALVATGNIDKEDINVINQEIAFQFLCDYMDAIIKSEADMTTLENTLSALGKKMTLEQYNSYYKMLAGSLNYEVLEGNGGMNFGLNFEGKKTIDSLLSTLGMGDSFNSYLGMVAEYKDGVTIDIPAHATLVNAETDYCALILDAQASGITNKFECIRTNSIAALQKELSSLAGYSVVILLDDVAGTLTISGTTILDLNGHNVAGNITATGKLFIIDSTMDTYNAGMVEGNISGAVTVIAGNYSTDVSSFLKDGYYMDGTTVRNAMYYIECDENGNVIFVVNSDVYKSEELNGYVPDVKAMALDMFTDLLLNYVTTAGLTVDGNKVYDVNFQNLVGMLEARAAEDVIDSILACVSAEGISGITNNIIADLLDFGAIHDALENGTNVAEYEMTVAPWMVEVEHVEEKDYFTVNIESNTELAKTFALALRIDGDSINYVKELAGALSEIVEEDTKVTISIEEPEYNNKELWISAAGSAVVSINMSQNTDYAKALAIILAYGNRDKAEAVVAAIKGDNMDDLKVVIDNTTVAELFKALKAMNRGVNLLAMAKAIGLDTANLTDAAGLEQVYHLNLVAIGKALEKLDITGRDSKLVGLYNEETGYYELSKNTMFRDGELLVRSYGVSYELSITELSFSLKLFGVASGEHEHDYTAVVSEPTCTEGGYTTYTCSCGDSYVADKTEALGHSYKSVVTVPTCTEGGYTTHTCSVCGDTYVGNMTPAWGHEYGDASCDEVANCIVCGATTGTVLGHSFTKYVSNGDATCTKDGTKTAVCDRCDATYTVTDKGSALGHTEEKMPGKDATCTESGISSGTKCSICGEVLIAQEEIEALGHTELIDESVAATCTETGLTEGKHCSVCGEVLIAQEEVEALGHTDVVDEAVAPTCTETGLTEGKHCSVCGEVLIAQEEVEALGHTDVIDEAVAATCTETGLTEGKHCSVCGEILVAQKEVEVLGHSFGGWTVTKKATCTEAGEETRSCVCGKTEARVIDATGEHIFGEWEVTKEPSKNAEGEETHTCSQCGHTETRPIDKLDGSFPWWILVLTLGVGGTSVGGFFLLKKRKFI